MEFSCCMKSFLVYEMKREGKQRCVHSLSIHVHHLSRQRRSSLLFRSDPTLLLSILILRSTSPKLHGSLQRLNNDEYLLMDRTRQVALTPASQAFSQRVLARVAVTVSYRVHQLSSSKEVGMSGRKRKTNTNSFASSLANAQSSTS